LLYNIFMEKNKDIVKHINIHPFLIPEQGLYMKEVSFCLRENLFIFMEDEEDKLTKRIKMIMKQFSGDVKATDEQLIPEVAIMGSGILYCYSPSKRRFVKIARGTKAYVLSLEEETFSDKILIYTFCGRIVEIDVNEIIRTGFD